MTTTAMKVIFKKQKPKIIFYRNYKNFDKKSSQTKISETKFRSVCPSEFALKDFQNVCLTCTPQEKIC